MLKQELEELKPEVKTPTEGETVKHLKIVMTDLSTITSRHEQQMSSYEANVKEAKEKTRSFEEKETARIKLWN